MNHIKRMGVQFEPLLRREEKVHKKRSNFFFIPEPYNYFTREPQTKKKEVGRFPLVGWSFSDLHAACLGYVLALDKATL
jgi:hypothetical protein